jgi:hypothetical protein
MGNNSNNCVGFATLFCPFVERKTGEHAGSVVLGVNSTNVPVELSEGYTELFD